MSHGSEPIEEGNLSPQREEDDAASVSSSVREDNEAMKPSDGADMRVAPEEHSGFYVMLFFNIFAFMSFGFMVAAAAPIEWYSSDDGEKWTVWKDASGVAWRNVECQHKMQIFQATAAFAVCGAVLCFATFIAGVLQMMGRGHMGVSLLLAIVSMTVTLTAWSLNVFQYHKYNCPGEISYVHHINRLSAGFSITLISFALLLFGIIDLGYYFLSYYAKDETRKEDYHGGALNAAILTLCTTVMSMVGCAFTMWETYYPQYVVKVTFWHVEILYTDSGLSEFRSIKDYHCSELTKYFQAGGAFAIISTVFLYITMILMFGAVYNRACKWAAFALGLVSWVCLLVCWAVMIGARYKNFCPDGLNALFNGMRNVPSDSGVRQNVHFTGFVITEGLGLLISSWCVITVCLIYFMMKA